jgi:hypothetical protein
MHHLVEPFDEGGVVGPRLTLLPPLIHLGLALGVVLAHLGIDPVCDLSGAEVDAVDALAHAERPVTVAPAGRANVITHYSAPSSVYHTLLCAPGPE